MISKKIKKIENIVILNNIRSVFNVASIFRICDCAGIKRVVLCGVTPGPKDRFGRLRKDFAKVSLGAENFISYDYFSDFADLVKDTKAEGFEVVALEQDEKSIDFKKFKPFGKTAIVVGREREGFSKEDLKLCDRIVEIPMRGNKESLNVNVALAVFLFSAF
jgi:tRNA G18 (ribose-2'-O)-methylase SpoU